MVIEFKLPDLGEGLTEAEIRKWLVKEGDLVQQDQSLAEVETDKAVVEMPSPAPGRILKLHHPEGAMVMVGETLVSIDDGGEETTHLVEERKPSVSVVGELPEYREETEKVPGEVGLTERKVLATPAVRKLAKDKSIEISTVEGTGPSGRVTEDDLIKAVSRMSRLKIEPKFDFYGFIERRPLRGVRRTTAKRMIESQVKAAQVTAMEIIDVTKLVELRQRWKNLLQDRKGTSITYMPFIIKAVVEALKLNPVLNSTLDEEREEIILKKYYNIGFAVATGEGLIVPVIKGADQKSLTEIAEELDKLVELASTREIDLGDLKGGTFTITNYGVFGGTYGTPIINFPETTILGTGRIADTPMVLEGEIMVRKAMHVSLTFDHRVMDGADVGRFMNDLKMHLEDPDLLLLTLN